MAGLVRFDGLGHFKAFWGAPQVDGEVGTNKTPCSACDGCDNCLVGDPHGLKGSAFTS